MSTLRVVRLFCLGLTWAAAAMEARRETTAKDLIAAGVGGKEWTSSLWSTTTEGEEGL